MRALLVVFLAIALLLRRPTSAPAQSAPTAPSHRTQQSLNHDLIEACEHEDAAAVAALLRQGANANARGKFRQTALMAARNNVELARILLAHGAAINARDKDGDTVLNLALPFGMRVSEGDQPNDYVVFLLEHGANVNLSNDKGYTPLMHAVAEQAVASTALLLAQGARVQARDRSGRTALIIAADFGDWDVGDGHEEARQLTTLRQLLEHGANINAADHTGRTALMAAAYHDHRAIFGFLLEHGAAMQAKDRYGRTVLTWALSGGARPPLLDRLRPFHLPVGVTEALLMNDLSQARDLLTKGAGIGVLTPQGDTSLILAAETGDIDLVERLLKRGAPVNQRGYRGTTALMRVIGGHLVVWSSGSRDWKNAPALPTQIRLVRLLLAHGADPNLKTEPQVWGDTALTVAKEVKNEDMVAILTQAGAHP